MKNLVLASALGTLAGAFAAPVLTGPIHFQVTKPYSMFGWLPAQASPTSPSSVTLGTVPGDFVVTDVIYEAIAFRILVKVNGNPVLCAGNVGALSFVQSTLHMTTGVLIPGGSSVVVEVQNGPSNPAPITLVGYIQ